MSEQIADEITRRKLTVLEYLELSFETIFVQGGIFVDCGITEFLTRTPDGRKYHLYVSEDVLEDWNVETLKRRLAEWHVAETMRQSQEGTAVLLISGLITTAAQG